MSAPEIVGLALLDGYKVRWSRETVARDIVQNFFDEVDDFDEVTVEVDDDARTIEVRGPSRFDMEYLKYLGATTKAAKQRSAGGFGEGFKVCALVLLRDFRCAVTAGSGAWEIRPLLRPMKLGRELCYEVRRLDGAAAHEGSFVRIEGADDRLLDAFDGAKDLFVHPANPRLARPIHVDEAAGAGVWAGLAPQVGDMFYRGQHRGRLRFANGGALTFSFDERIDALEGDRDRRDLAVTGPLIAAVAARLPDEVLRRLIHHLRAYWQRGGRVLGTIVAEAKRRGIAVTFPRRWLSRARQGYFLERRAERLGYHLGLESLRGIGMPSVEERFGSAEVPRAPTAREEARAQVARELYAALTGQAPLFERVRVVDLERPGHDFRARSCVMPAPVLAMAFSDGIGPCLTRLACGTGRSSRTNADRLTALLEGVIREPEAIRPFAERWERAARDPSLAGASPGQASEADDLDDGNAPALPIAVLAPQGYPPTEAMKARVERLCKAHGVKPWFYGDPVRGPREARVWYARGVPSIWVGEIEIEPPGEEDQPSYALRTFAGPDGARMLAPGDEALAAAIAVEAAIVKARGPLRNPRFGKRRQRGHAALLRWLRATDPAKHREQRIDDALREAARQLSVQPGLARSMTRRALLADAEVTARSAGDHAITTLWATSQRVAQRLPEVEACLSGTTAPDLVRRAVLAHGEALVEAGAGEAETLDALVALAPAACRVAGWMEEAPLDEGCARVCAETAYRRLSAALGEGDMESALVKARERFDASVEQAMARHEMRDAEGEPIQCYTLWAALGDLFHEPWPGDVRAVEAAVRGAWDAAIAAGLGETEAAERALEAARPFESRTG